LAPLSHDFPFNDYGTHLVLHSFPTRRSSDLHRATGSHHAAPRPLEPDSPLPGILDPVFNLSENDQIIGGASGDPSRNDGPAAGQDRKSTRLNSSHLGISYAVFCLKKKTKNIT